MVTDKSFEELKPCPFCGDRDIEPMLVVGVAYGFMRCNQCGAEGPRVYVGIAAADDDEDRVIFNKWNLRSNVEFSGQAAGSSPRSSAGTQG
jgi:Lar family restriction alleviation protein